MTECVKSNNQEIHTTFHVVDSEADTHLGSDVAEDLQIVSFTCSVKSSKTSRISRQITLYAKACKICKLCRASLRYLESLCCQVNNAQLEIALERINASPLPRRRHASVNTRLQDERIDASPLIALECINASPLPRRRHASVNTRLQDERIDASPLPRRRRSSSNPR
ncbi:hypothetical protein NDU88_009299 [Pleurodeles waltl]|uniref:Uncharacterized protein n=1 Tax=Pleurodeles waltl TaxID=8319 RepID=A0AAV7RY44_PLEWA|nr:hypothetical protein NDU88_009299 [Pleurodeles waltl]